MNFENMTVIWDSQKEEPLYAINKKGLLELLLDKRKRFNRKMRWQERQSYIGLALTLLVIAFFLILDHSLFTIGALTVAGLCWTHFAYTVFADQREQARRERVEVATLRDELERDISQVQFQIDLRRHIALRHVPPYLGCFLIFVVMLRSSGLPLWLMIPIAAALVFSLLYEARGQRQLVERTMVPRMAELESLRSELADH